MFIARATCESEKFGKREILIYTENETKEISSIRNLKFAYCAKYDCPIGDAILKTAAKEILPARFECNGIKYTLVKYTVNCYERYFNKYRKNHVVGKEKIHALSEIYVYSQRCRCVKCFSEFGFDKIVSICGVVPLRYNNKMLVEIDIQKCEYCNKYFIDNQSLNMYEKKYGELYIKKKNITGNEFLHNNSQEWIFCKDSILSRNGYFSDVPDKERKQILVNMMENGISKAQIIDKLSEFIYFRSFRCPYASEIWKEDLEFVNEYELGSQKIVYFR